MEEGKHTVFFFNLVFSLWSFQGTLLGAFISWGGEWEGYAYVVKCSLSPGVLII